MNKEEMRREVRHAAELHGVTTAEVVAEVVDGEPGVPEKRRGWMHWTAWLCSMVAIGVVVGGLIVAAMKFVNDPVVQAKTLAKTPPPSPPPGVASGSDELLGLNFTFTYPGEFDQVQRVKTDLGALEQYNLTSKANYRHMIAVNVRPLTSGQLDDDASYRLRQMRTGEYREMRDKIAGEPISIMIKSDGHEKTLFWAHQAKLLTVSVTSTDVRENVGAFMDRITSSVRWRQ